MTDLGDGGPPEVVPRPPALSLSYEEIADGELVGQGGDADVYRTTVVRDGHERPVAVKQPRLQGTMNPETVERFVEEAEVWAQLDDHDHVVTLFDRGTEPLPWLAMEYMDGGTLETQLAGGRLPLEQSLWVGFYLCKAVRHAHRHGIVHHDLKPANVLFRTVEEGWMVPKVSDWGLATQLLEVSDQVQALSVRYAAPEQFEPETHGPPDDRTDIYQLGTVLYELLTGRPPFEGPPATVKRSVLEDTPPPPSTVSDAPAWVDEPILTTLSKQKDDRYDSVVYLRDLFASQSGVVEDGHGSGPAPSVSEMQTSNDGNQEAKHTQTSNDGNQETANSRQRNDGVSERAGPEREASGRAHMGVTTETANRGRNTQEPELGALFRGIVPESASVLANLSDVQLFALSVFLTWLVGALVVVLFTPFGQLTIAIWTIFVIAAGITRFLVYMSGKAGDTAG